MKLDIKNLVFGYNDRNVLDDVSFSVDAPAFVSVLGPNGVGKSTLIHCINRILEPRSGIVEVDGRDVSDIPKKELAKFMAYVPCTSATAFPMSVADTVMLGRYPHSGNRRTDDDLRAVHSALKMMGIEDLAMRSFNELSAGQHQKVMLARGLAQESRILLLDEPTANLDIKHQIAVARMLKGLSVSEGMIIIMICHDLNIASRYSDRIILLNEGKIFADGSPDDVLTPENIDAVYGVGCEITEFEERPHLMFKDPGSGAEGTDHDGPEADLGAEQSPIRTERRARALFSRS